MSERRHAWSVALVLHLSLAAAADVPAELPVPQQDVWIDSGFIHIAAETRAPVSDVAAWRLLTALGEAADYLPGIDSSRVVARTDSSQVVRQVMTTHILFPWTFRMQLEFVAADSARTLRFRQLHGSLHDYDGHWSVTAAGGGGESVVLRYEARARLRQPFPGFLVSYIVSRQVERMMAALVGELILRKSIAQSLASPADSGS